tara:strand:- start:20935 stop:22098 length:1164 start_codon:yes stop_codon:yes gene_type:complete
MAMDYTSINEVINDFQLMIDDTSYDKEAHVYQLRLLAFQGLRELTFDVEQVVETTTMTVSSSLQVTLPSDYVKMLKIGYKNSADEFVSLGYKDNLSLDAVVTSQISEDPYDENNPYFHTDMGRKYGVGGGQNALGYYRLNRNDNTINFSSDLSGKTIFMEYISDGIGDKESRDHIISISLKSASSDGFRLFDKSFKIPSPASEIEATTISFIQESVIPTSNTQIRIQASDSAQAVAEKIALVLTEGYPEFRISPFNSNLKVNSANNGVLKLVYSNLSFIPISLNSSSVDFSTNISPSENACLTAQSLIELGVPGNKPRIHKFCEEALRCYMYYKYIQRKRGIPANEKQMAKRAYYNEKRLARARMMNFNKEAAMQVSRKAFKQSPKL